MSYLIRRVKYLLSRAALLANGAAAVVLTLTFIVLSGGLPRAAAPVTMLLAGAMAIWLGFISRPRPPDYAMAARVVAVVSIATLWAKVEPLQWHAILAVVVLVAFISMDAYFRRIVGRPLRAANLPGVEEPWTSQIRGGPVPYATTGLTALLAATAILRLPQLLFSVVTLLAIAFLVGAVRLHQYRLSKKDLAAEINLALESYSPEFLLYFSAPVGSEYQAMMWLPHLEATGKRFAIMTRELGMYRLLASRTTVPLVRAASLAAVESGLPTSLTTIFYVNNGAKNVHTVRFRHLTHVQLLHGDSDKPPSYSPVTGMYDKIFVAGQAGIDRYEKRGVSIAREKFEIVGRPQVQDIAVATEPIAQGRSRIVGYAPTWHGQFQDTSLSSLPFGLQLVEALVALGETVWFRPHPYSQRNRESRAQIAAIHSVLAESKQRDGLPHRWGDEVGAELPIVDFFNGTDALLTDISSVGADYLFSRKPMAISDAGLGDGDAVAQFPMVEAAYVIASGSDPRPVLSQMLGDDPLMGTRDELRTYYLGDFPSEDYGQHFVSAARRLIETPKACREEYLAALSLLTETTS